MQDPDSPIAIGAPVPNWSQRPRPDHSTLNGRAVTLRALDPEQDAPALYRASHGTPELEALVWTYLPIGPYESESAFRDSYQALIAPGDPLFYTVVDTASDTPIGVVSFLAIQPAHGSIEIGHIWYGPEWQGTAANTEACYLMLREAFDRLGYRRLEWKCDGLNSRSRAAALRLGFRYEGLFRQHYIVKGRNRDTAWFSILDSEWPAIRVGLERWLGWNDAAGPRPSLSTLR